MFSFALELWSLLFPPKRPTMDDNPFPFLLSPTLSMETGPFKFLYWSGVTSNPDPQQVLSSRFKVDTVSVVKKKHSPEHEFVLVAVTDGKNQDRQLFILERTVDLNSEVANDLKNDVVDEFLLHEDSQKIINAVLCAIPPSILIASVAITGLPGTYPFSG
jgi:hypothetical protein